MEKKYPESKVEIQGFAAKFYDNLLNFATLGGYSIFLKKAIQAMEIHPDNKIIDFGAGTGRNALLMKKYLSENGEILGLEISESMISQFKQKTRNLQNINIVNQQIDQPFEFEKKYDKVFISFVLHGFPFKVQKNIIRNALNALKDNGEFIILDFNEFVIAETPLYFRIPFKIIECKYAFEYVKRDWKQILSEFGFGMFREKLFFKNHIRLLKAVKGITE
jgi:ubiquinone/menaquinone biosynthesis C-methylase UbiE